MLSGNECLHRNKIPDPNAGIEKQTGRFIENDRTTNKRKPYAFFINSAGFVVFKHSFMTTIT